MSASRAALPASLRHNRPFRVLWVGSTTSMLGSRLTTIAFPMLILWLTRSPAYAGLAVFAVTAPSILFYVPAGALVDRWDPRRTMLVTESCRGLVLVLIVITVLLDKTGVPLIIVLAMVEEILEVFASLAERRYLMAMVGTQEATPALIRTETRTHLAVLAGRPLGGLFFEVNPVLPFLADALSFVVSVSTLFVLRREPAPKSDPGRGPYSAREVFAGFRWVQRDAFTRFAMPLASLMTLISQALIIIFIADAAARHLPSVEIGLVLAASGAGGAIGALAAMRIKIAPGYSRIVLELLVRAAFLLALCLVAASWRDWFMAVVMLMLSFTGAMSNIELDTHIARQAGEALARVTSVGRLLSFSASAIGPAVGGLLAATLGTHGAVILLSAVTIVLAIPAWAIRAVRAAPRSTILPALLRPEPRSVAAFEPEPEPVHQLELDLDLKTPPAVVPEPEPVQAAHLEPQSVHQLELDLNPKPQPVLVPEVESRPGYQHELAQSPMVSSGARVRGQVPVPITIETQVTEPPDKIPVP
jgi:MFS family permease